MARRADGGLGTDGLSAEVAAGPLPDFEWRADLPLPTASAAEQKVVSADDEAVLERWESHLAAAAATGAARAAAAAQAAVSPAVPTYGYLSGGGTLPAPGMGAGANGHAGLAAAATVDVTTSPPGGLPSKRRVRDEPVAVLFNKVSSVCFICAHGAALR